MRSIILVFLICYGLKGFAADSSLLMNGPGVFACTTSIDGKAIQTVLTGVYPQGPMNQWPIFSSVEVGDYFYTVVVKLKNKADENIEALYGMDLSDLPQLETLYGMTFEVEKSGEPQPEMVAVLQKVQHIRDVEACAVFDPDLLHCARVVRSQEIAQWKAGETYRFGYTSMLRVLGQTEKARFEISCHNDFSPR
ncbi:MAG: hypothetical protein AAF203_01975 [Pseudomonadota bacterium]